MTEENKPSAYLYTLEYGGSVADTKVSLHQLNYPFGVCGADYLRENKDGTSYVKQTPLYTHPAPVNQALLESLRRIADPIVWEQEHLPKGYKIDGPALVRMVNSAEYYQNIARAAIAQAEGKV